MTPEKLAALKEVAEAARRKRPGRWAVRDSCSWRRIGTVEPYGDGNVICPTTQRGDNHPDLLAGARSIRPHRRFRSNYLFRVTGGSGAAARGRKRVSGLG
jgi:hypothetical protein